MQLFPVFPFPHFPHQYSLVSVWGSRWAKAQCDLPSWWWSPEQDASTVVENIREQWCCNPTCTCTSICLRFLKEMLAWLLDIHCTFTSTADRIASCCFSRFQTLTRRMDFPPQRYFQHIHRSLKPLWHMTQSEVITCFSVMLGMLGVPDKRITWREASSM